MDFPRDLVVSVQLVGEQGLERALVLGVQAVHRLLQPEVVLGRPGGGAEVVGEGAEVPLQRHSLVHGHRAAR